MNKRQSKQLQKYRQEQQKSGTYYNAALPKQGAQKRRQKRKMFLSFSFIVIVIIAFLAIFALSGRDLSVSTVPTPLPATTIPAQQTDQSEPQDSPAVSPAVSGKIVLLDPGHGGFDVGTEGSDHYANEDALNLAIALKVGAYLSQAGITPIYTRSDNNALANDKMEDMRMRVNKINSSSAQLAVSIHMNSYPEDASVKGPEVYYYGYTNNQFLLSQSSSFAANMQSALNQFTGGRRSYRAEDLMVLRDSNIPAILIECGFLSNPTEESNLNDETYQDQLAQTIAICILQNFF